MPTVVAEGTPVSLDQLRSFVLHNLSGIAVMCPIRERTARCETKELEQKSQQLDLKFRDLVATCHHIHAALEVAANHDEVAKLAGVVTKAARKIPDLPDTVAFYLNELEFVVSKSCNGLLGHLTIQEIRARLEHECHVLGNYPTS